MVHHDGGSESMKKKPKIQNSEFKKKRKKVHLTSSSKTCPMCVSVGVCMCDKISATEMNDNQKKNR